MGTSLLGQDGFGDSMSGQQIYDNFTKAKGPGDLQEAQDHLRTVMSTYKDRVQQITSLAASMEEGWTGNASQAAQRSAVPLASAHDEAGMQMVQASQLIESQAQAFYDTKNRVVPVPEVPKSPSFLDNVMTLGSANTTHLIKVVKSQAAAQQNVNAMAAWSTTSSDNGSRMPSSYGTVDGSALDVTMASSASGPSVGGGGGNVPGGGGNAPMTGGGYPPAGAGLPPSGTPPIQSTQPVGYHPPSPPISPGPPPVPPRFSPPVGGPITPGPIAPPGLPPSSGPTGGIRGGAGSGLGGRAAGSPYGGGGAGEKALGGGNRVGAGAPGAANESFGRAGSAGTAGKPGASGMGAGAHGGKGKGEEDADHERKYVLDEDEAFQLTAEGEQLVDPNTGLPVAPPVIGY